MKFSSDFLLVGIGFLVRVGWLRRAHTYAKASARRQQAQAGTAASFSLRPHTNGRHFPRIASSTTQRFEFQLFFLFLFIYIFWLRLERGREKSSSIFLALFPSIGSAATASRADVFSLFFAKKTLFIYSYTTIMVDIARLISRHSTSCRGGIFSCWQHFHILKFRPSWVQPRSSTEWRRRELFFSSFCQIPLYFLLYCCVGKNPLCGDSCPAWIPVEFREIIADHHRSSARERGEEGEITK